MTMTQSERPLTGRAVLITVCAFFAIVIGVNVLLMKLAIDTLPGTEVDSAYSASLQFTAELAAAKEQEKRGWQVNAHVERSSQGKATITVSAHDRSGMNLSGIGFVARLTRPTDKRADQMIVLVERQPGAFQGETLGIDPGQWDLVIEAKNATGRMFLSHTRIVLH